MTQSMREGRTAIRPQRDLLFLAILGTAIGLTVLVVSTDALWGSGPVLVQLPGYIPLVSALTALTTLAVAYLALGRYYVFRDSISFWVGSGFAVYGIGQIFYALTWPGVLPGGSILGHLPNTSAWIALIDLTLLGTFLLAALRLHWPDHESFAGGNGLWPVVALLLLTIVGFGLLISLESDLPAFLNSQGVFTTPLRIWVTLLLILFLVGSTLSTLEYRRSGNKLIGYIAFPQIALIFISMMVLIGGKRYDLWWYLQRVVLAGGHLVVLFGLLSEDIRLLKRESEGRRTLEALFESLPVGVALTSGPPDFSITWVSQAGASKDGSTESGSAQALSQVQIFFPDGVTQPTLEQRPHFRAGQFGEEIRNAEFIVQTPDGQRNPVLVNASPIRDAQGNIRAAISTWIDITDRKRAEEILQESEALYRAIARNIPNGAIYVVDRDMRYQIAEGPVAERLGHTRELLEGRTVSEVFDAETAARMEARFQRVFAGETISYETESQGRIYWTQQALIDRSGSHAVVITLDVTERRQAEKVWNETEQRFRAIINQTTAGIVRSELDGMFAFVNQAFCDMLGYTEAELLGKTFWQITYPEDLEENRRLFERLLEKGWPYQLEKRLVRQDGSVIWVNVSASPVLDAVGKAQSTVSIIVDITERKQAEEALQQWNLQLESHVASRTAALQTANEALLESRKRLQILSQRLVQVQEEERRAIARELHDRAGQTLAALNINLMIINGQLSQDDQARLSSRMQDSMELVAQAISLIRDVMTDLRPAVLEDYGLEAALHSYIDHYRSRHPIEVRLLRSAPPVPRLEPSLEMTLLRIAQEALTNVARHAQATQAQVSLQQTEDGICLTVQDNGVGLPISPEGTHTDGHGVRIMRERAEAFGGSVTVRSAPGQGTTIEAVLPLGNHH